MARKHTDYNSETKPSCTEPLGAENELLKQQLRATAGQLEPTPDDTRTPSPEDLNAIRQYLLGSLNDDQKQAVEERLLTDTEFFEELEIVEDELVDEFLADDLTETERDRFQRYFMAAPDRQRNLRFAQAMRRQVTPPPPTPTPWWNSQSYFVRAAAAVVLVTILAGLLWIFRSGAVSEPKLATLTLTISDSDRSTGANVTNAKRNVDEFRIVLKLPDATAPASRYRVELTTATGESRPLEIVKQDAQSVSVVIPTNTLSPGLHAIRLYAISAEGAEQRLNGDYFLNVE
jgi:anti-sigma-K factor RskA